jgi:hypothetical protein
MAIIEKMYRIESIPDLSLSKYSSLAGKGVDGVLDKHLAFLRMWNRKGSLSGISVHLFYVFNGRNCCDYEDNMEGSKLEVIFLVRGKEEKMKNVPQLVSSSPLSEYFAFAEIDSESFKSEYKVCGESFLTCSTLIKKEIFVRSSLEVSGHDTDYYLISDWETNDEGRLYNMMKLMESLDERMIFRVDLYPVEYSALLRDSLRRPMSTLRDRQSSKTSLMGQRDYEAEFALKSYQDLIQKIESSPHFLTNMFVFADDSENANVILDSAGAEAIKKGSYEIANFSGKFSVMHFLKVEDNSEYFDPMKKVIIQRSSRGLNICNSNSKTYGLRFLPTLFTLEEISPFFRFPTLFDGEVVQKRKETSPKILSTEGSMFIGIDDNGYPVNIPLKNFSKHAFIAGVPGSGKTNAMYHIASSLWKNHNIPFLVLEPAKQEYRALLNQPGMENVYFFSPNADMQFPLHINPFEFPKGLVLSEHIRKLCTVFEGAFPLENPMPFLLDQAIEAIYRNMGWTPDMVYTSKTNLKFPTLQMLYKRLEDELKSTTYSQELRGNLESALKVRIGSLLRREMGDVFNVSKSSIAPEDWLKIPAIIELESMGTGPANFLTLMLCTLIREALKVEPHHDKEHARHVIFIEEAHNLIGPVAEEVYGSEANPKQAATAFVVKMLAEVRALNEGIIIADQLPTVMAQEVIKNTGLKIGMRITSSDDRNLLGSTMAANSTQIEQMAVYETGKALTSYEGLQRPFTTKVHEWCGRWNKYQCKDEIFDISWCKSKCELYEKGDCFPELNERKKITTPKSDLDLAKILGQRDSYRRNSERSFIIEAEKVYGDLRLILNRFSDIFFELKELEMESVRIVKEESRVVNFAVDAVQTIDWEDSHQRSNQVMLECDSIRQWKESLVKRIELSGLETRVYQLIAESSKLIGIIENRKKRWIRIGIKEFSRKENDLSDRCFDSRRVEYVKQIEKGYGQCVILSQRLLELAKVHMNNNGEMQEWIKSFNAIKLRLK